MFKVESNYQLTVQSQDQGTIVREHPNYDNKGPSSLKVGFKYYTEVETLGEDTVVAKDHNTSISAIDIQEGPKINSTVGNNASLHGAYGLTEAALAAHVQHLDSHLSLDEVHVSSRSDDILRAALEMGFNLPRECFQLDEWDLPKWIEAQTRLRAKEY